MHQKKKRKEKMEGEGDREERIIVAGGKFHMK
jgi:hypothetical protein